jgi:hypothetical protein
MKENIHGSTYGEREEKQKKKQTFGWTSEFCTITQSFPHSTFCKAIFDQKTNTYVQTSTVFT